MLLDSFLEVKMGLGVGVWCLIGDFNAICRREERRGVHVEDSLG